MAGSSFCQPGGKGPHQRKALTFSDRSPRSDRGKSCRSARKKKSTACVFHDVTHDKAVTARTGGCPVCVFLFCFCFSRWQLQRHRGTPCACVRSSKLLWQHLPDDGRTAPLRCNTERGPPPRKLVDSRRCMGYRVDRFVRPRHREKRSLYFDCPASLDF